jgi:hypothetical protein
MKRLFLATTALLLAAPASAGFFINYEGPNVQNTTAGFTVSGVETFESRTVGAAANFSTDFGTGNQIVATYTGGRIDNANQFGSSGGTGKHIVTFSDLDEIEITFTTTLPTGLTYFGYWLSALDNQNRITFYNGATELATITPGAIKDPITGIGACPNAYCGNQDPPFVGDNSGEPYAFLNVYFTGGDTYDRIRIYQVGGGGYESDNHTVGFFTQPGGVIPEPATWAMMISGFGLVGFAARRRRGAAAIVTA